MRSGENSAPAAPPRDPGSPGSDPISATLYHELHRIAAARMRSERPGHTLQPTALVNEAYLRLQEGSGSPLQAGNPLDRARFLGLAAHVMRNILVDHARAHRAGKRGAGAVQVTLDDDLIVASGSIIDILAVDSALKELAAFDARQAEIVELHFFGGLTFEEIAAQLGLSLRTVKGDSSMARAWLRTRLLPAP